MARPKQKMEKSQSKVMVQVSKPSTIFTPESIKAMVEIGRPQTAQLSMRWALMS